MRGICKHRAAGGETVREKLSIQTLPRRRTCAKTTAHMADPTSPAEPADLRPRLTEWRTALLALHKALLDSERRSYEESFGRTLSAYDFLHLLTSDPWFAWLAPVTHLLADVDALLDAKEPLTIAAVNALAQQGKILLTPTETGEGFSRQFDEILQRDPDVLFAHVALSKLLRAQVALPI